MNRDWLGHYSDGGDSWEDGRRTIHFTSTADGQVRFDWVCRYEGNHGYSESSEWGRVVAADDTAITVELAESESSSWEDLFKEHLTHRDTSVRRVTIEIAEIDAGIPKLRYSGADFRFVR
ncbi:MAG: hypothetical protein JNL83_08265 [Myxococcales bacterium]|nr:hypothetical protein [Myxococcales bacterium]